MHDFWQHCLAPFEKELPTQQFITWIKPLKVLVRAEGLTITAPNRFVLQWVRDKFHSRISDLASAYFQQPREIQLLLAERDSPTIFPPATVPVPDVKIGRAHV